MYTVNTTIDQVIETLRLFIIPFIPNGKVYRTQVNRVPMPIDPFVILTELFEIDLDIPYEDYSNTVDTTSLIINGPTQIDIQIDFYGNNSGDYCRAVKNAFRTSWGFNKFPSNIKPLYMSKGIQTPLLAREQQWENRWTTTASLQYNPIIEVSQSFASSNISISNIKKADT